MSVAHCLKEHVVLNASPDNSVLDQVYKTIRNTSAADSMQNSHLTGLLYTHFLSDRRFIETNNANTQVLWSLMTALTYYLLRFVYRIRKHHVTNTENTTRITVPEQVVEEWFYLIDTISRRLQRRLTWYDLLYANNCYIDSSGAPAVLLTVRDKTIHTDGEEPTTVLSEQAEAEANFALGMVMVGGARPEVRDAAVQHYIDIGYLTSESFHKYYVSTFNLFYLIHPPIRDRLANISMLFPITQMNATDMFDIEVEQDPRYLYE